MSDRVRTIPTLDRPLVESGAVPPSLAARPLTKEDYDRVVQVVDHWWEGPIAVLAHPMFFYEFGKYARVVEDVAAGGKLVGFLLGFVLPAEGDTPALGYIHLVGIDPAYRRKGVARLLGAAGAPLELSGRLASPLPRRSRLPPAFTVPS